ncbi:MAG TPA: HEAT repeat domain-containing protein [Thermoanaerobaculia bacterium]|nr:HEAT repeat domain-containing protein [Thermoanaerobaculia bacterium]
MRPRISFKSDSSFFEKLAIGVAGAESVRRELESLGHSIAELERGALETKLWREVKRKRVRIPDLVCTRCGQRIESRAKTRPELSMSHSLSDATRSWDSGLVPGDWIAFPVISSAFRRDWVQGRLVGTNSYWRERRWAHWRAQGAINVFDVASLLGSLPKAKPAKGVTEGSESQVYWPAVFATQDGVVTRVDAETIRYYGDSGRGERRVRLTGAGREALAPVVALGDSVRSYQVLAASASPLSAEDLTCRADLNEETIAGMLRSRRESVRYTGCRLAKLVRTDSVRQTMHDLARDPAEDLYTRLEARSYLVTVAGADAREEFGATLSELSEAPWRLESIVTLADTPAPSARELLKAVLANRDNPLFLRSAAAWALGRFPERDAAAALVASFADVDRDLRQEAVAALVSAGTGALEPLLEGLSERSGDVAAGCFEVLRRLDTAPVQVYMDLAETSRAPEWAVWLLASLPRHQVGTRIAAWQMNRPDLHFAISVLWSFLESWVSETWERNPDPQP